MVFCWYLNAKLLVATLYASRRSCDLVTLSRFYVVFIGPKTNVNFVTHSTLPGVLLMQLLPTAALCRHSCPSNTKLSPDAERLCFALPNILPSSFFSALHSCLLLASIRRISGHSLQTLRSVILILPISCSFFLIVIILLFCPMFSGLPELSCSVPHLL